MAALNQHRCRRRADWSGLAAASRPTPPLHSVERLFLKSSGSHVVLIS